MNINLRNFLIYGIITFGITWTFWLLAVFSGQTINDTSVIILIAIGGLGPTIGGLSMIYFVGGKDSFKDFINRLTDIHKLGRKWLIISLFGPFIIACVAIIIDVGIFRNLWDSTETIKIISNISSLIGFSFNYFYIWAIG